MFLRRKSLPALLAAAVALTTAGCGGGDDASADAGNGDLSGELEQTSLSIGIPLNTYTLAPLYNAIEGGHFADEGLDVELVVLTGGTTPQAALLGGSVDMIHTGLSGLLQPVLQGVEAHAIWGGILATPYALYAQPEITDLADAEGRSLHITSLPSDQGVFVQHYLSEVGLTVEDVTLQEGGGSPVGLEGLQRDTTDISILVPPTSFQAEDEGFVQVAAMEDVIPEYPMHMVQAMDAFVAENPNTIRAFLRGLSLGTAETKSEPELTAERLTQYAELPPEYAARAVESFQDQMFEDGRIPDEASMETFWEIYTAVGAVEEEIPQEDWLDDQFISTYEEWK